MEVNININVSVFPFGFFALKEIHIFYVDPELPNKVEPLIYDYIFPTGTLAKPVMITSNPIDLT